MPRQMIGALRERRPEHTPEAEGLVVDTDTPEVVRLELDDGEVIALDRRELISAVLSEVAAA